MSSRHVRQDWRHAHRTHASSNIQSPILLHDSYIVRLLCQSTARTSVRPCSVPSWYVVEKRQSAGRNLVGRNSFTTSYLTGVPPPQVRTQLLAEVNSTALNKSCRANRGFTATMARHPGRTGLHTQLVASALAPLLLAALMASPATAQPSGVSASLTADTYGITVSWNRGTHAV